MMASLTNYLPTHLRPGIHIAQQAWEPKHDWVCISLNINLQEAVDVCSYNCWIWNLWASYKKLCRQHCDVEQRDGRQLKILSLKLLPPNRQRRAVAELKDGVLWYHFKGGRTQEFCDRTDKQTETDIEIAFSEQTHALAELKEGVLWYYFKGGRTENRHRGQNSAWNSLST